jgi:hypothetical protein
MSLIHPGIYISYKNRFKLFNFRYTCPNKTKKRKNLNISPIRAFMSDRKSSRLHNLTSSTENIDDDDLIVPLKRVLQKKKAKIIVSSDSDDTIIIEDDDDEPSKPINKKVVHRRKIIFYIKYI